MDEDAAQPALPAGLASALDALVEDVGDVVAVYGEGGVRYLSPSGARQLGSRPVGTAGAIDVVHPDDQDRVRAAFAGWVAGSRDPVTYRVAIPEGGWRRLRSRGLDLRGHPVVRGVVVTTRSVGPGEDEVVQRDALTGLGSRAALFDEVGDALRRGPGVAVLAVDVDRFASVNTVLGYRAGDAVLRRVGEALQAAVRPHDGVARLGGDRFAICCERVAGAGDAEAMARRVQEAFASPLSVNGHDVHLSVSVGVAVAGGSLSSAEALLGAADAALRDARRDGPGAVGVAGARQARPRGPELEDALRGAMERGELHVAFQPLVDLGTGRPWGVEALARWHSPDRGVVPPAEFVPVAEESGLIVPLGAWVLDQACAQAAAWRRERSLGHLTVSVNVSARQLAHGDVATTVAEALAAHSLEPAALCLEITETTVMSDRPVVIETIERLRALGVGLAVDDFGVGYSSLLYLKRFRPDQLKIDRSFVAGLEADGDDASIVRAVVGLAHGLGLRAVAEGVETGAQLDALRALGCDLGQGYLWSRPVRAAALTPWLRAASRRRVARERVLASAG